MMSRMKFGSASFVFCSSPAAPVSFGVSIVIFFASLMSSLSESVGSALGQMNPTLCSQACLLELRSALLGLLELGPG